MGLELAVRTDTGAVCERIRGYWVEVWPLPIVSSSAFADGADKRVQVIPPDKLHGMVFREDSFDATTRIRRGRFYSCAGRTDTDTVWPHVGPQVLVPGIPRAPLHYFQALTKTDRQGRRHW